MADALDDEPGRDGAAEAAAPAKAKRAKAKPAKAKRTNVGRPKRMLPIALVLLVALVGALVVAIWFGIKAVQGFSDARGMANAESAAESVAEDFTTFDVATGDADVARMLKGTTARYAAGFSGDTGAFFDRLKASQARSSGTVTSSGVVDYDPVSNIAHVLVTVRAQVTMKDAPNSQQRDYRMELTMVDQSWLPGGWKADSVDFRS